MGRTESARLSIILASLVCCGSIVWLFANIDRNYHYDFYDLYNSTTKQWLYPKDFMNVTRNILKPDEWLASTNAREQLYETSIFWNTMALVWLQHEYSNKAELAISGGPVANSDKCGQQLNWIVDSLKQMPDPSTVIGVRGAELTRYLDSFGRPEPGFHWAGALNWFGSHSLCLKANLNGGQIKSRYCLAHFRYNDWPEKDFMKPKSKIKLGICLPETCDTMAFDKYKDHIELLAKYQLNDNYKSELIFDSMYCLPDERSELRQIPWIGKLLVSIMSSWFLLIIIASLLRSQFGNKFGSIFNAFTLQNSFKSLLSSRELPTEEPLSSSSTAPLIASTLSSKTTESQSDSVMLAIDLRAWNFLKVLASFMVIYGHTNSVSHFYSRTFIGRLLHSNRFISRICFTFGNLMTTYFVLFGLFSSIKLIKFVGPRNVRQLLRLTTVLKFFLPMICHIVPLYALVHFANQNIVPFLGHGPAWDYGTGLSLRRLCFGEPWWRSIPLLATIWGHIAPPCNSPGWFIVAYLQLAPLVPLLTYILYKLPSIWLKVTFTLLLLLISNLNGFIRLLTQNVIGPDGLSYINGFVVLVLDKFEPSSYQDTLGRLGSVTLGCLIGVLLIQYKRKEAANGKKSVSNNVNCKSIWPEWFFAKATYYAVVLGHLALIVVPSMAKTVRNDLGLVEFAILIGLMGICWALLNAILIIQLANAKQTNSIISFMNHPFWDSLNKLNLAIYLVHLETIIYANQVHEHAPSVYGHTMDILKIYCFSIWVSYAIAIVFYLFIEAPLMKLLQLMLKKQLKHNNRIE